MRSTLECRAELNPLSEQLTAYKNNITDGFFTSKNRTQLKRLFANYLIGHLQNLQNRRLDLKNGSAIAFEPIWQEFANRQLSRHGQLFALWYRVIRVSCELEQIEKSNNAYMKNLRDRELNGDTLADDASYDYQRTKFLNAVQLLMQAEDNLHKLRDATDKEALAPSEQSASLGAFHSEWEKLAESLEKAFLLVHDAASLLKDKPFQHEFEQLLHDWQALKEKKERLCEKLSLDTILSKTLNATPPIVTASVLTSSSFDRPYASSDQRITAMLTEAIQENSEFRKLVDLYKHSNGQKV